jgi:predicted Ser/Thr protein kinase
MLWFMHALGEAGLPRQVELGGVVYLLEQTHKHDFFAATGFYRNEQGGKAVVKIGRTVGFLGLPLRWIGRALLERELRAYRKLSDLKNIPPVLGTVGDTGFAHVFIEGAPLSKHRPVPDDFFARLFELMDEMARRGIAYVDTNKPENILQGEDGLPYLIDFQISFDKAAMWNLPPSRWLLKKFTQSDRYHVLKHKKRLRPDQLTEEERYIVEHRSLIIRIHRTISRPYHWVRKPLLRWLRGSGRVLPETSK